MQNEQQQVESERQRLEERYINITHELQSTQRELRQTQMVNNYLYQEKQLVENFNKNNPQLLSLKQVLEQVKTKSHVLN